MPRRAAGGETEGHGNQPPHSGEARPWLPAVLHTDWSLIILLILGHTTKASLKTNQRKNIEMKPDQAQILERSQGLCGVPLMEGLHSLS